MLRITNQCCFYIIDHSINIAYHLITIGLICQTQEEESLSITHDLIHIGLQTLKNLARSERTDAIPNRIAPHAADSFSMNTNFT